MVENHPWHCGLAAFPRYGFEVAPVVSATRLILGPGSVTGMYFTRNNFSRIDAFYLPRGES
jgi:hypothetical protein